MAEFASSDKNLFQNAASFENEEEQKQELEVLESIYGNDFCQKESNHAGYYCFQVACKVLLDEDQEVLLEPVLVSVNQIAKSCAEETPDQQPVLCQSLSGQALSRFPVRTLPPAILDLALPRGYPTEVPPEFTLHAEWLDDSQAANVRQELLQLWDTYIGSPIVFVWCDYLANNLLNLASNAEGVLCLIGGSQQQIEEKLMSILQYNRTFEQEKFLNSEHLCGICFTEKTGHEFFRLQNCKHHFCTECFEAYCNIHVTEGTVQKLQCPDPECDEGLPPHLIKAVVSEEDFERWERLSLQKTLDSMSDVAYCPRCMTATIAETEKLAQCPQCHYCFCGLCRMSYHPGEPCVVGGEQADKIMKKLASIGKEQVDAETKMRKQIKLKEELANLRKITGTCKQCPSCRMFIEKNGGCNKVTCSNCGTYVCWICGQPITGYEHFSDSVKCNLWEEAQVQKWNQQMEYQARQLLQNDNAGGFFLVPRHIMAERQDLLAVCPMCRCRNYKTARNNHIHCFGCRIHFCKLCGEKVFKVSEHFRPGKCRQHTD